MAGEAEQLKKRPESRKTRSVLGPSVAVLVAYAFFAFARCLSLIPDIAQGPFGYGKGVVPSVMASFVLQLMPTKWFPFAASPFVFWIVGRTLRSPSNDSLKILTTVGCFLFGSGALIIHDLLFMHGTYAVESPAASLLTTGFNIFLVLLLALVAILKEVEIRRKYGE
jgi:hypothetical protein